MRVYLHATVTTHRTAPKEPTLKNLRDLATTASALIASRIGTFLAGGLLSTLPTRQIDAIEGLVVAGLLVAFDVAAHFVFTKPKR